MHDALLRGGNAVMRGVSRGPTLGMQPGVGCGVAAHVLHAQQPVVRLSLEERNLLPDIVHKPLAVFGEVCGGWLKSYAVADGCQCIRQCTVLQT